MVKSRGFGLLEVLVVLVVLVVVALLTSPVVPAYDHVAQTAKVSRATGEILAIGVAVERFRLRNDDRIPMSLDELASERILSEVRSRDTVARLGGGAGSALGHRG